MERFTSFQYQNSYMRLAVQLNNIQICFLHYNDVKGVEDFYLQSLVFKNHFWKFMTDLSKIYARLFALRIGICARYDWYRIWTIVGWEKLTMSTHRLEKNSLFLKQNSSLLFISPHFLKIKTKQIRNGYIWK